MIISAAILSEGESSSSVLHDPITKYIAVAAAGEDESSSSRRMPPSSSSRELHFAMKKFSDALSDTRRILDDDKDAQKTLQHETENNNNNISSSQQHEHMDHTHHTIPPPIATSSTRSSSDWWERLYQGGPLYDKITGNLIEDTADIATDTSKQHQESEEDITITIDLNNNDHTISSSSLETKRPDNRRSHSATMYKRTSININSNGGKEETKEYMIISGGFTDEDWNTFPVYAYDITNSRSIADIENEFTEQLTTTTTKQNNNENNIEQQHQMEDMLLHSSKNPWIDLSKLNYMGTTSDLAGSPHGRVGHLSSVYNDCLYVFGGLTYQLGSFHVDYNDSSEDESEDSSSKSSSSTLAIWKACGLDEILISSSTGEKKETKKEGPQENEEDGEKDGESVTPTVGLKWEKIVPKVNNQLPIQLKDRSSSNGGNANVMKNDDDKDESENKDESGSDDGRRKMKGQRIPSGSHLEQSTRNDMGGIETPYPPGGTTSPRPPDPTSTLSRGEAQGGHYHSNAHNNAKDSFIFYGGMHHHQTLAEALEATTILGDVWKFDYESETLIMLAPYPPLEWQRDERNGAYPMARTAHAGTIVGNELIIHGGMRYGVDDNKKGSSSSSSSFASPSSSYATYKTSERWQPLSDVWVFDLITFKWKERMHYPQLARSYHSMVGWGNGTVAAFGGFQQDNNIPGETVAFVFKDMILSRPNETYWQKLLPPYDEPLSYWHTSGYEYVKPGITNRLEHSAVVDQYGSMYIWGGRFQTVNQIVGFWRLDVFTKDANLKYENAPPDGIEQYEAELQALHMFIATMMFMSLTISSLFSMMRRQAAEGGGDGGGVGRSFNRRGLSRQVIDSLPLKTYQAPHTEVTEDGDVVEDVSLSRENSRDESTSFGLEDADCCPICLVEYEDGVSEIRTLPCGHCFDRECIDSWLAEHTTCPSCRDAIDNTPLSQDEAIQDQYEFDPRWQFISAFENTRRRHAHWGGVPTRFHQDVELVVEDSDTSLQTDSEESRGDDAHEAHAHAPIQPSLLRIRNFFNRRGHMAVPGEEEDIPNASIELV